MEAQWKLRKQLVAIRMKNDSDNRKWALWECQGSTNPPRITIKTCPSCLFRSAKLCWLTCIMLCERLLPEMCSESRGTNKHFLEKRLHCRKTTECWERWLGKKKTRFWNKKIELSQALNYRESLHSFRRGTEPLVYAFCTEMNGHGTTPCHKWKLCELHCLAELHNCSIDLQQRTPHSAAKLRAGNAKLKKLLEMFITDTITQ